MATDIDMNEKVNRICGGTAEEVSLETIRAEVAQYLQLDRLNFLIGAGCSSHLVDGEEKASRACGDYISPSSSIIPTLK